MLRLVQLLLALLRMLDIPVHLEVDQLVVRTDEFEAGAGVYQRQLFDLVEVCLHAGLDHLQASVHVQLTNGIDIFGRLVV